MDALSGIGDQLFSVLGNRFSSLSGLSGTALSRGIDLYQNGDYEGSVREFRRAIALDPYSDNSLKAYDFMSQAYLKLGRTDEAEKAYITAQKIFPYSDSLHLKLGNLYYSNGRKEDAEKEYIKAVRINPSTENLYPLGQLYISMDRNEEAEDIFLKILSTEPRNYGAIYSLGQVYAKKGLYNEAIKRFEEAINIKRDFSYAYYDLGTLYADMGEFDMAEQQAGFLDNLNQSLAEDLRAYIYKIRRPEIIFVNTFNAFNMQKGPGTPLSSLDPSLSQPGSSKDFSITVYFDKPMDRNSVENIAMWSISRATGENKGGAYNWGLPVPVTDVALSPLPQQVIYNSDDFSATLIFRLTQNNTGDGTIDPSHLVFRFYGKDAYGNKIAPSADEYVGLSLIV